MEDEAALADRGSKALWPGLVVAAVYLALAVGVYWNVWTTHPASVSQPGGDQFSNMWFLRWVPFALAHGHNPFFSNFANYPFGVNLLVNTSSLFLGALVSPVTVLWGPVAAFNTVSTLALAASAGAGYLFVREWTAWRPAAFVGGLLYGFGPYAMAQSNAGHTNLTFVVFPPLILLVTSRIVVVQRGRPAVWGIVLGLLVTAQFFVSTEVLASTVVIAVIGLLVVIIAGRRSARAHLRYALEGGVWALGVAVVLLAYPVWFALAGPGHISGPIQLVPQGYRADLAGIVLPDSVQRFAPSGLARTAANFSNSPSENGSYLGITLLVVLLAGTIALWRRSAALRVGAVLALSALLLSLGGGLVVTGRPGGIATGFPLPERAFEKLPLLSNTIPARYALFVELFAALLLGVILDRLHRHLSRGPGGPPPLHRPSRRRRPVLLAGLLPGLVAAVALVPLWPLAPFTAVGPVGTPPYFTSAALQRIPSGSVAVVYPYSTSPTPDAQAWQAISSLHFRMPGGYFLVPGPDGKIAFSPPLGYVRDTLVAQVLYALSVGDPPALTPALRVSLLAQLHSWGVASAVAVPGRGAAPAAAMAYLTSLFGRPPLPEGGGTFAWYGLPTSPATPAPIGGGNTPQG
jgi:hypothetical protein